MLNIGHKPVPLRIKRTRIKYARIEVRGKKVYITVPYNYDDIDTFIKKHLIWIEKKLKEYDLLLEKSRTLKLEHRDRTKFYITVRNITRSLSMEMGISMPVIRFRRMRRKWASMNSNHIMTLNVSINLLPERLVRYILFHEMCHIIEMSHNGKFKSLISGKYPYYRKLDIELRAYWIAIEEYYLNTLSNY
ncbi:MAG: YgjP-like metallopeptidase domain-containing protein [Conexivisphaerales archaeon]